MKYIEIVSSKTDEVIKRFDVSGLPQNKIDEIYEKKGKRLAKSKFLRIITSGEELEAEKAK